MSTSTRIEELERLRQEAQAGGGSDKIEKHHAKGCMTARERLAAFLDPGTFHELDTFVKHRCTEFGMEKTRPMGDGVVTGYGKVDGRLVYTYAQDFTVIGGSLGEAHAMKICKVMDMAMKAGAPLIGLNDSGGARIQEGVESLGGYAEIFFRNVNASGVIPQISVIMGPCAGGAVYSPAITDFIIMVDTSSHMFITGPQVIESITGEKVSFDELGGSKAHSTKSGVCHLHFKDEQATLEGLKKLLSFIPSNNTQHAPMKPTEDPVDRLAPELDTIIPDSPKRPYDMKRVIRKVVDDGDFLEIHPEWAPNILVGFAHLGGRSVGIIANQPFFLAGCLNIDASIKGARFIRFCDAFNIPIITFEDVPGFLPGVNQEHGGIIRNGAKLLYAYAEANVPKITVITRKSYGGAYCVMASKHLRADYNFSWPTGEIAVMGPDGAVGIVFRKELASAEDKAAKFAELVDSYRDRFASPYIAAERGFLDDVIKPSETRPVLIAALESIADKKEPRPARKHGNIPL